MAIVLEANYSKKLGLPGYSSHQYSVTLRTEVADLSQVESESNRLHALLQASVDREIQKTGFLPEHNGNGNGHTRPGTPANGMGAGAWACSPKQQNLILKIVEEQGLRRGRFPDRTQFSPPDELASRNLWRKTAPSALAKG